MSRTAATVVLLAAVGGAATGCTPGSGAGAGGNSVDAQVRTLTARYDCGHTGDQPDPAMKGALIYIPGRPDRVAVVPIPREHLYLGPAKYVHDSFCVKAPSA